MPPRVPIRAHSVPPLVLLLVFPGFQAIDLAGPLQAFATAAEEGGPPYRLRIASLAGGPIRGTGPLDILSEPLAALGGEIDTLIVPGGPGIEAAAADPAHVQAVAALAAKSRRVCSVCTGAFLLAATGLLDGRQACTHWRAAATLAARHPRVRVNPEPIYLRDGNVYTSAGVSAGMDLALALIDEDAGAACAGEVARRLVVHVRRPGGQSQYSEVLRMQNAGVATFATLLADIAARPGLAWRAQDMAQASGQSLRSFHRKFVDATGERPAAAVERIRVECAGALLGSTSLGLKDVARRSGFASEQGMRRAFLRVSGRLPSAVRRPGDS